MAEQFANNAISTLDGTISDSDTELSVLDATLFPVTGDFRLRIDDELMLVTGVAGSVFTVTRAQEGTVAVEHLDGAQAYLPLTAASIATLAGSALPAGGAEDDVLAKLSGDDYDVGWVAPTSGGGTHPNIPIRCTDWYSASGFTITRAYGADWEAVYTSSTNGGQLQTTIYLEAGSYTLVVFFYDYNNDAIVDVYVGGTKLGTHDQYAAGYTDSPQSYTFTVASDFVVPIRLVSNGKNASSSGYRIQLKASAVFRTA